jgi:hypothetical protein
MPAGAGVQGTNHAIYQANGAREYAFCWSEIPREETWRPRLRASGRAGWVSEATDGFGG